VRSEKGEETPLQLLPGSTVYARLPERDRKRLDSELDVQPLLAPVTEEEQPSKYGSMEEEGISNLRESLTKKYGEKFMVSKLFTDYGVEVFLVPVATGKVVEPSPFLFADRKFHADEIWVQQIAVGDQDRPATQFVNQESHTVAWTLVRHATMALAGQRASALLDHLRIAFRTLVPFLKANEATELMSSLPSGTLEITRDAVLPIDVWRNALSSLLKLYAQVYQLSRVSTYKRG